MGLASGDYRVVVRAQGFSPEYVQPVRPNISSESVIDIKMSPGSDQKLPFEMSEQEMEQLKKEMERAEKRKQSSEEVKAFFEAGLQLVQQQKYPEAIEEFKKALEKDPEQASVIGNMADCYLKMDKKQEALDLYQKAIAISPNEAALYTNLGVVLNKMGKNAESQEAFKKAAALNPGASAQNLFNIGIVMYNNYQYAEAAEQFKQTIAADANYAEAYYRLGSCLLNMGQKETWPDAIKALQKYVQIGKDARNIDDAKAIISALEQSIKK
jgi:tetratricopeptide (TPR) repeat protein